MSHIVEPCIYVFAELSDVGPPIFSLDYHLLNCEKLKTYFFELLLGDWTDLHYNTV